MADFSIFLGNHVRPITDPLRLRFLLFVIHNQKDLNKINDIYLESRRVALSRERNEELVGLKADKWHELSGSRFIFPINDVFGRLTYGLIAPR